MFLEKEDSTPYNIVGGYLIQIPVKATGTSRAVNIRRGTTIPMTDSDDVTMTQANFAHTTQPIVVWGTLPQEDIIGHVLVRLFPLSSIGVLPGDAKYQENSNASMTEI